MTEITSVLKKLKPVTFVEGDLDLSFNHRYGEHFSRFYVELRDNKKILGMRCGKCGAVLLPPRPYCGFCHTPLETWVEVPDTGTVKTFSVVHVPFGGIKAEPPYACAMIKLDDCDVSFCHLLGEVAFNEIEVGMKVVAVWEEERKGTLGDIRYFKPL